jgi:hypothetical protein
LTVSFWSAAVPAAVLAKSAIYGITSLTALPVRPERLNGREDPPGGRLGAILYGATRNRDKRQRREQARELRQEADTRTQQAEERERVAQEQMREARESHRVAAEVGARADQIDPDSDTPAEDE